MRKISFILESTNKKHSIALIHPELALPFFYYDPNFDCWDNIAAARFLYEQINKISILGDHDYIEMFKQNQFKFLLSIINEQSQIQKNSGGHKIYSLSHQILDNINYEYYDQNFILHHPNIPDIKIIEQYLIQSKFEIPNQKFYAVLDTWEPKAQQMKFILEGCFYGAYQGKNEKWKSYKVYIDEYPSLDEINQIEAFIITGSPLGVYEKIQWYDKFFEFIRANITDKRFLGTCFGHQALGGQVEKMEIQKNYIGPIEILSTKNYQKILAYFSHGDQVIIQPPNSHIYFTSDHCKIQALHGNNFFSTQFHPELNCILIKFIAHIMDRNLDQEDLIKLNHNFMSQHQDCHFLKKMCKDYLKGKFSSKISQ